jgi:hypothetical protein
MEKSKFGAQKLAGVVCCKSLLGLTTSGTFCITDLVLVISRVGGLLVFLEELHVSCYPFCGTILLLRHSSRAGCDFSFISLGHVREVESIVFARACILIDRLCAGKKQRQL